MKSVAGALDLRPERRFGPLGLHFLRNVKEFSKFRLWACNLSTSSIFSLHICQTARTLKGASRTPGALFSQVLTSFVLFKFDRSSCASRNGSLGLHVWLVFGLVGL